MAGGSFCCRGVPLGCACDEAPCCEGSIEEGVCRADVVEVAEGPAEEEAMD